MTTSDKTKARRLWQLFRLTPEQADKIEAFERAHPIYKVLLSKRNAIDHDHKTGRIRGKLDWLINRAYGMLEKVAPDNLSEVLMALAVYHDENPAVKAIGTVYGLIGQAKRKRKMIYGSANGPLTGEVACTKRRIKKSQVRLRRKSAGRSRKSSRKKSS